MIAWALEVASVHVSDQNGCQSDEHHMSERGVPPVPKPVFAALREGHTLRLWPGCITGESVTLRSEGTRSWRRAVALQDRHPRRRCARRRRGGDGYSDFKT